MSLKDCQKAKSKVDDVLNDFVNKYEDECGRLTDAIEAAYFEGFEDARSDADNEVNQCWRVSAAKREQDI